MSVATSIRAAPSCRSSGARSVGTPGAGTGVLDLFEARDQFDAWRLVGEADRRVNVTATSMSLDGLRGLDRPEVKATLARLHEAAKADKWIFLRAAPAALRSRLSGGTYLDGVLPYLKDAYIPISPEQGAVLYQTSRLIGARTTVEFGTSFGISAIYLAAAARENGGRFIGTEIEPNKIAAARANLAAAGLADVAEIRAGDAMHTLRDVGGPIDLVLLDGWKDLYLPVLHLLRSKLRKGSVVFADNIFTFPKELAPYVAFVRDAKNGFESLTLPLGHGMEYSVCTRSE